MFSPVLVTSLKLSNSTVSSFPFDLPVMEIYLASVLLDFSLTVKAATLIFISGCGSAISSAKEGKSGFIYNLLKI